MSNSLNSQVVPVGGQPFQVAVRRASSQPIEAPRLVAVARVTNAKAFAILQSLVETTRHFTPQAHELWIVDNGSLPEWTDRMLAFEGVNLVFNQTPPIPLEAAANPDAKQEDYGSFANGIGLELGAALIDPGSRFFMSMHMDAMPCRRDWLPTLREKIEQGASAAGVELHRGRTPAGVLHPQGLMLDFQRFRQLGLDFMPALPQYDVADRVSIRLREAGDRLYAFRNSLWETEMVRHIAADSLLRDTHIDRAFDDDGNIFYLHLGRGVVKAAGEYYKAGRLTADEWVDLANRLITSDRGLAGGHGA